jgi:choline dehydrogenase-like flavoprotein
MGGSTLAWALSGGGANVLIVERGDFLPPEPENWDVDAVFKRYRYKAKERWASADGGTFVPGVHYVVGGNTKVYGGSLPRLRASDFEAVEHLEGTSPAWPIRYADLAPYYDEAERLYGAHGEVGEDPTEPDRGPFPFPAVPHEPVIERLAGRLRAQGLHPFHLPMGIDLREGGRCIRCRTCDGFPCKVDAKFDAEIACLRPALASGGIELRTRTYVRRVLAEPGGHRVRGIEIERDGATEVVEAGAVVVACGSANSAALLLRSSGPDHPHGLANGSGVVGRNYMVHNNTALMAVDPFHENPTMFQKSIALNDFYFQGPDTPYPLGNVQGLGKLQKGMLAASKPLVPPPLLGAAARRSIDLWVMSEDLPDPDNRVTVRSDGTIQVRWRPTNNDAHRRLVREAKRMMRRAGYRVTITERMGIATNSHQVGTVRFGTDPTTSALDPWCRAHEVENLFVVDGSFFPSSAAVNPALTIAAQALRVGARLRAGSAV